MSLGDHGSYYSFDIDACIFVEEGADEVYAYYLNNDTWLELEDGPEDIDLENGAFYYDIESNRGSCWWGTDGSLDVFAHFEKFLEW